MVTARLVLICAAALSLLSIVLATDGYSQKNNRNQQDERRENERVQQAEKRLKQTQKELAEAQKQLREELSLVRVAAEAVQAASHKLQEAKEAAEERLAESLGIAPAIEKLQAARKQLKQVSAPIIERLHETDRWQQARAAADQAAAEQDRVEADLELSDSDRLARLKQLREIVRKPYDMELAAVASDPEGKRATEAVNAATKTVTEKRSAVSADKVMRDPLVTQAAQALSTAQAQHQSALKSLTAGRASSLKAQNQMLAAQKSLAQARQADAADSNRSKKKR